MAEQNGPALIPQEDQTDSTLKYNFCIIIFITLLEFYGFLFKFEWIYKL